MCDVLEKFASKCSPLQIIFILIVRIFLNYF